MPARRTVGRGDKTIGGTQFALCRFPLSTGDGQFNSPRNVSVDAAGYVYVADTNNQRVQKFDGDGNFVTKWGGTYGSGDGEFIVCADVATDSAILVYAADRNNNRIQKFSLADGVGDACDNCLPEIQPRSDR